MQNEYPHQANSNAAMHADLVLKNVANKKC